MLTFFSRNKKTIHSLSPVKAYNLWAPTYDQKNSNPLILIEEKFLSPYLESLDVHDKTVIDFGCGTGRYFKKLTAHGAKRIVGADLSHSMLEQAKNNSEEADVSLVNSSLELLPFRDSQYDVGVSTLVLGYISNLNNAIAEMSRVLQSGGTMLMADLHPVHETLGWKRTFIISESNRPPVVYEIDHHHHTITDYLNAFDKNHLSIELKAEPCIDSSVMDIFEQFGMKRAYRHYTGTPILLIFKLQKN